MCKNAASTAASLMSAIEPTLVDLLTFLGLAGTPNGQAALKAYNAAVTALQNWQPGNSAQDVIQVINAFTAIFDTLPFPSTVTFLVNIISAGVVTVIGILEANSPAPVASVASGQPASTEETQALHQVQVIQETTAKVQKLVPSFNRSIFTSPAQQYKNTWNAELKKMGSTFDSLKQ